MGSALAFPAAQNGHTVRLVGTHLDREIINNCTKTKRHPKFERDFPSNVTYHQIEDIDAALAGADLLIGGISSFGVEWFFEQVLLKAAPEVPVLTVTKGLIEHATGLITYLDYWIEELKANGKTLSINAVAGPCTSYELVSEDNTVVTFCGYNTDDLKKIRRLLQTDYYHIDLSADVIGCESAAALKNCYALAITMTIGLNERTIHLSKREHYNSQAAVFGQSIKEMRKLIAILGGGECIELGASDLYVTVFGGRTRLLGRLLGKGLTYKEALKELEGVTLESTVISGRIARFVQKLSAEGKLHLKDFPLLVHVDAVLNGERAANIPWTAFT